MAENNLTYTLSFEDYKNEFELICKYNPVEVGQYWIIEFLIRSLLKNDLCITNVSTRRSTKDGQEKMYKSPTAFPYLVIINTKNKDVPVQCAIEVKFPIHNNILDYDKYLKQVYGHIDKFKNVIYTDGIHWRFYEDGEDKPINTINLGTIENNDSKIEVKYNENNWDELLATITNFLNNLTGRTIK